MLVLHHATLQNSFTLIAFLVDSILLATDVYILTTDYYVCKKDIFPYFFPVFISFGLIMLKHPVETKVVKVGILALLLISRENHLVFHY